MPYSSTTAAPTAQAASTETQTQASHPSLPWWKRYSLIDVLSTSVSESTLIDFLDFLYLCRQLVL